MLVGVTLFATFSEQRLYSSLFHLAIMNFLKTVLLKEFEKLHVLFDKVLYRMDYHDFQAHVYDNFESGMHLLKKLWKVNSANNLNAFKNWCATHPPNDLTRKMLDRIAGGTSILESLMVGTNYNENIFTKVEGWLENLLQSLAILSGSCEKLYSTDSETAIQDEFAEILRKILFEMTESKTRLFRKWPESVKDLVEKAIDANRNNNDKLVLEIFNQLKQKFVGFFYVAVRDSRTATIGCDSKKHLNFGAIYKEKGYIIARSTCQKPLTDPPTPFSNFSLPLTTENIVEYFMPKYCNTSSMIYAAERESFGGYSYFRDTYDSCAIYGRIVRQGHLVIDYTIVPE
ncbi:unnamed protein product, partial [Mesorhabditis belari]|uniref:Uncharacterized protein n=1 Tax=Mesorhabditis belari TaxID=2138241 RepID=A0AAF3J774_9BILA